MNGREFRNARIFASTQARYDALEPPGFNAPLDDEITSFTRTMYDTAGFPVDVLFELDFGCAYVVGVYRDDKLCTDFSQTDATSWCHQIDSGE